MVPLTLTEDCAENEGIQLKQDTPPPPVGQPVSVTLRPRPFPARGREGPAIRPEASQGKESTTTEPATAEAVAVQGTDGRAGKGRGGGRDGRGARDKLSRHATLGRGKNALKTPHEL